MCKRKSKPIRESNNSRFWLFRVVRLLFVAASVVCTFFKIPCPEELQSAIGVAMQIITALAAVVISISLQNEEVFGTKTTKLYNLRSEKHYSVKCIVIISIALCTLSTIFYLGKWFWMVLGMLAATIVFLLQVVCSEVPIMMKNHKAIISILKGNLVRCYLNVTEAEKDLKDPMRYLLYKETINQVYKDFKDSTDDKYNTYLILKLLEYQCDLAGDLIERYSDAEKAEIASSLLDNVCNILYRSLEEVPDEAYISIEESKHLLIYTLFRIHELPSMQNLAFRYYPSGFTFNVKGMSAFPTGDMSLFELLAFANSVVANYLSNIVNPSISFGANSFANLPLIRCESQTERIAEDNTRISQNDWDSYETSWNFKRNPLI